MILSVCRGSPFGMYRFKCRDFVDFTSEATYLYIYALHKLERRRSNYIFNSTQAGISSNVTILMYFNSKIMTSARYKVHLKCINMPGALSGVSNCEWGRNAFRE
jgi:hypothetical protein